MINFLVFKCGLRNKGCVRLLAVPVFGIGASCCMRGVSDVRCQGLKLQTKFEPYSSFLF